jgi:hypothetical protein
VAITVEDVSEVGDNVPNFLPYFFKSLLVSLDEGSTSVIFFRYGSIAPASASIDAHSHVFIKTKVQINILITIHSSPGHYLVKY